MANDQGGGKPTVQEKRRVYLLFFVIAFAIDFVVGMIQAGTYRPTLIGSAIMITAALFFIASFFRGR
ncbi:MAG: hypothetical protein MJE12_23195 [Alphaproteobacteria bacterium]|nr:hypothetical protein [Alphaproteobacteria bacterium]